VLHRELVCYPIQLKDAKQVPFLVRVAHLINLNGLRLCVQMYKNLHTNLWERKAIWSELRRHLPAGKPDGLLFYPKTASVL